MKQRYALKQCYACGQMAGIQSDVPFQWLCWECLEEGWRFDDAGQVACPERCLYPDSMLEEPEAST